MSAKRSRSPSPESGLVRVCHLRPGHDDVEGGGDSGRGMHPLDVPYTGGASTGSDGDGQAPASVPTPGDGARNYGNATLGPTLRSAGLGQISRCFLCTFTDAMLADGSMFADACGPLERVARFWNENADTMDMQVLSEECLNLLREQLKHYVTTPLNIDADRISTGESAGLGGLGGEVPAGTEVARQMTLADVTPQCIKHHFTMCVTTRSARLTTLRMSFRHIAQLEAACAGSMYSKCAKTGRPKPDPAVSALLLKANTALLRTSQLISGIEGKGT